MSLRIRRIAVNGFRKFREPMAIDGLTDGLNIVIEPNETGKSTLLEALRAAFFVRHSTKNQLAQSFAPHGEAVAPEIEVGFEADGVTWSVTKRFLKGASIEITGPKGRAQGDEAEARLHALLGSVRDTTQRGDPASYGALGLLWVAQTEALSVTAPGQMSAIRFARRWRQKSARSWVALPTSASVIGSKISSAYIGRRPDNDAVARSRRMTASQLPRQALERRRYGWQTSNAPSGSLPQQAHASR